MAIRRVSNKPYQVGYEIVDLEKVAKVTTMMPRDFIEGDNGISQKFIEYAMPLVGELPETGRLHDVKVTKPVR